jgi:hypothetical protein
MKSRALAVLMVLVALCAVGCADPTPRPPGTDGTARWAFNLASPKITGDYELRQILGARVFLDGRLAANTGQWDFVAWSPSLQTKTQVTVKFDGTTSESKSSEAAPGPGVVKAALPATWADSPTVVKATDGKRDAAATHVQLMVANFTDYPKTAGQAVWGMSFDYGKNQLAGIDGTYIGEQ